MLFSDGTNSKNALRISSPISEVPVNQISTNSFNVNNFQNAFLANYEISKMIPTLLKYPNASLLVPNWQWDNYKNTVYSWSKTKFSIFSQYAVPKYFGINVDSSIEVSVNQQTNRYFKFTINDDVWLINESQIIYLLNNSKSNINDGDYEYNMLKNGFYILL